MVNSDRTVEWSCRAIGDGGIQSYFCRVLGFDSIYANINGERILAATPRYDICHKNLDCRVHMYPDRYEFKSCLDGTVIHRVYDPKTGIITIRDKCADVGDIEFIPKPYQHMFPPLSWYNYERIWDEVYTRFSRLFDH